MLPVWWAVTALVFWLGRKVGLALIPGWPEGAGLIGLGIAALLTSVYVERLGLQRTRWLIGWAIAVPTFLLAAWLWP